MNQIEHVFKLSKESIDPSSQSRTQGLRDLLNVLEEIAQNLPKKIFYNNKTWFFNEDDQTKHDWEIIGTMLEVLEIPVQDRELGLFGFYSLKMPKELMLQNFDFLRGILPNPENTEFEIQKLDSSILRMLGREITHFRFSFSTLEIITDVTLVLSDDDIIELKRAQYEGKTIWEIICSYSFIRPIKYIIVHSISTYLSPKGKIEKKHSAQINLAWDGSLK